MYIDKRLNSQSHISNKRQYQILIKKFLWLFALLIATEAIQPGIYLESHHEIVWSYGNQTLYLAASSKIQILEVQVLESLRVIPNAPCFFQYHFSTQSILGKTEIEFLGNNYTDSVHPSNRYSV